MSIPTEFIDIYKYDLMLDLFKKTKKCIKVKRNVLINMEVENREYYRKYFNFSLKKKIIFVLVYKRIFRL